MSIATHTSPVPTPPPIPVSTKLSKEMLILSN